MFSRVKAKKRIPVFVIEEHNEAFFVWNYCLKKNIISNHPYSLIHVDEHSDMGVPRLNKPIFEINENLRDLKKFTKDEIGIANFIYPAIYLGILKDVYWIKQHHRNGNNQQNMFITSYKSNGKLFITGKSDSLNDYRTNDPTLKRFTFFTRAEENLPVVENKLLDIDLDYFSCTGNPNEIEKLSIEITKEQYLSIEKNQYHRIYFQNKKIALEIRNNKYFLILNNYHDNYPNSYPSTLKVGLDIIESRLVNFIHNLKCLNPPPEIITICRSRYSGFTPQEQWQDIERGLLQGLQTIYDTNTMYINEF